MYPARSAASNRISAEMLYPIEEARSLPLPKTPIWSTSLEAFALELTALAENIKAPKGTKDAA